MSQEKYQVGDTIRFEFMQKQISGKISRALAAGLYRVEIDQQGDRFLPPWTIVRGSEVLGKEKGKPAAPSGKNQKSPNSDSGDRHEMPLRTWKDKSGKFEMQGSFVELVDGNVTLKKANGQLLTLPLDRLDPDDIKVAEAFHEDRSAENPFAPDDSSEQNPFLDATNSDDSGDAATPFLIKEMDFSSTKMVNATLVPDWKLEFAEPAPMDASALNSMHPVPEAGRGKIIRDVRTPSRIYVGNRKLLEKVEEGFVVDLATGKTLGPFTYPMKNVTTIAFDSKTNRLVTATTTGESKRPKTIDVWRIEDNDVQHQFGFVPTNARIVLPARSGIFLDDQRLLLTVFGKAGIFNLETMKAEAGVQFFNASIVQIDPSGRYLFGRVDDKTVIFDLATQKSVATLNQLLQLTRNFGFNDDMTRAAFTDSQRLTIWDLKNEQQIDEVILPMQVIVGTTPVLLDDANVLLVSPFRSTLVNLRLKSPIWSYRKAKFESVPGTSQLLTLGEKSGETFAGFVDLPSPPVEKLISSLTLEDLIVMPPGSAVCFKTENISVGALANIREQLEANGYSVVDDSPYELRAKVTKGPSTTRTYRDMTGGPDETVSMQSESYELDLYHGDEKIWYRSGGSGAIDPGNFVQLNEGETVQSRVNMGKGSPDGFYSSLLLPKLFLKTPPGYVHGTSNGLGDWN